MKSKEKEMILYDDEVRRMGDGSNGSMSDEGEMD